MRLIFIPVLVCLSALSSAGEIKYASAEHEGKNYRLELVMQVDVGREDLLEILMDHDDYHQLSEVMIESVLVEDAPEDKTRRRLVIETCVLLFCFMKVMVEDLEQFPGGRLLAIMVPEESDFRYGRTEWQIERLGPDRSEIMYSFELQPDFWIPPAIGPFIIKRKMIMEARETILKMENLAGGRIPNSDA